jgi:sortase A
MTAMRATTTWRVLAAALVLGACGGATTAEPAPSTSTAAGVVTASSTTSSSTTTSTTTTTTTTTTTVPPLPVPEPPPAPRAPEPRVELGRFRIPDLELDTTLLKGVSLTVLDQGPGHWPGTALPGGWGNAVVSAHRTSHGGPFRHLDQLEVGDEVIFEVDGTKHVNEVTGSEIVPPTALWIIDQKPGRTLTMFACHPPGSTAERIVVHGELRT